MAKSKLEHVVVDAVAFFRNVQLQDVADNVHTLRSVVNEIRDKATRQRLTVLPYELKFREPSTECIQIVSDFARKTGDYQSLSAVDIRVIALAYQLTKEYVGTDHLKKQPEKKVTYSASKKPLESVKDIAGFYYPTKKNEATDLADNKASASEESSQASGVQLELSGFKERMSIDEEDGEKERAAMDSKEEEEEMPEERTCEPEGKEVVADGDESVEPTRTDSKNDGMKEEGEMEMGRIDRRTEPHESVVKVTTHHITHGVSNEPEDKMEEETSEEGNVEVDHQGDDDGGNDEGDDEGDDDDVGWITPQNISQVRQQMGRGDEASLEGIKIGCMTTDFAMQNVLIQIGIPVISVNGMLIKRAKSFVLRCHDCFKVTTDMGKVFCPKCGNKSLDKVTMTIDEDGTQRYHLSRRRPMNTRGLRYALPKPQGGKHASNPILTADQRVPQNRESRKARHRTNVFDPDYEAMSSPFATHDITSRSAQLGVRQLRGQGSASRRNPNENRRQNKKGKRR